jgi:hypothetical protein
VPLTRFTMPLSKRDGQEWFDLLSSTYCSFAVCDEYARVVGCVDILTTNGPSSRNRYLKQTLLLQCSIRYWVASPAELPDATAIRADFLGTVTEPGHDPFQSASMRLHEMLDRNRSQRSSQFGNLDSDMQVQPQPDSFLGTLDSLHTPL